MSISLKNHEDRIKVLENKSAQQIKECNTSQNGYVWFNNGLLIQWYIVTKNVCRDWTWIDFPVKFSQKPFAHFGQLVSILKATDNYYTNNHNVDWNRTTNTGAYIYHASSYWEGWFEIKCLTIGLKIYYIFRYNIYKILKLISPILKF